MTHQAIYNDADPFLVVYIDRSSSTAQVFFSYDGGDDQVTPFQTADMSMDDAKAWREVNQYVEEL